jgi:hypothetical protein
MQNSLKVYLAIHNFSIRMVMIKRLRFMPVCGVQCILARAISKLAFIGSASGIVLTNREECLENV